MPNQQEQPNANVPDSEPLVNTDRLNKEKTPKEKAVEVKLADGTPLFYAHPAIGKHPDEIIKIGASDSNAAKDGIRMLAGKYPEELLTLSGKSFEEARSKLEELSSMLEQ